MIDYRFQIEGSMVISSRTPEGQPNRCPVCGDFLKMEPSNPAGDAPCPRCGHLLWFTWGDLGDVQVVQPTDKGLDSESLDRLFASVVMRQGMRLILDFSEVQYLSSANLAGLIKLRKRAAAGRGSVGLRGLNSDLRADFRICRLDQLFDIEA
jgi:anti-anti-sigma factor